jgi:hypothetical protein
MKQRLNRLSDPLTYKRVPVRTRTEAEMQRMAQRELLRDVTLLAYAFGFVVFLFMVLQ